MKSPLLGFSLVILARPLSYSWSMIFSENRYPLFGIML
jgi:hypothetical protein